VDDRKGGQGRAVIVRSKCACCCSFRILADGAGRKAKHARLSFLFCSIIKLFSSF
jgi:hypothetical protein